MYVADWRSDPVNDPNKWGPFGPRTWLSSIWNSKAVSPVEFGVVTLSGVEAVDMLPVPNYKNKRLVFMLTA